MLAFIWGKQVFFSYCMSSFRDMYGSLACHSK